MPKVAPVTRRILLATDLSASAADAAEQAIDLAADLRADLVILSVIDASPRRRPDPTAARVDQVRAQREVAAQALVARGHDRGVGVQFLIWEGNPGDTIVDAATSENVDLVVVGSHGRGTVGRFFVGSVSEHVVRNAPCPVLVVRSQRV